MELSVRPLGKSNKVTDTCPWDSSCRCRFLQTQRRNEVLENREPIIKTKRQSPENARLHAVGIAAVLPTSVDSTGPTLGVA